MARNETALGSDVMTDRKGWLITGAGRGMGTNIATAAIAAGNAVVATRPAPRLAGAAHPMLLS
jgi:NAD(P)-dependent dehydrogenase (short-subunit alcohol dehydrogenase family)